MKKRIKTLFFSIFSLLIFTFGWYMIASAYQKICPVKTYVATNTNNLTTSSGINTLKLGSYNIAHVRGGKSDVSNFQHVSKKELFQHLDRLSEQITQADLDIVVLNEIDFKSAWSHHINVAEYLMNKSGFNYRLEQVNMSASIPFYSFRFGNAILSKYPIKNIKYLDFPSISKFDDLLRGSHDGVYCEIQTPHGDLGVLPIHLEYRDKDIRVAGIKMILDHISHTDLPVIAFGDFNSTLTNEFKIETSRQGQNAIEYLLNNGKFISSLNKDIDSKSYTFPSENPDRTIDWIAGKNIKKFINSQTIASDLSDHLMITTEVVLGETQPVKYLTSLP